MVFGNKGGRKMGPMFPEQVTVSLTDRHMQFLKGRSTTSLADALRKCIEDCMVKETEEAHSGRT